MLSTNYVLKTQNMYDTDARLPEVICSGDNLS